METCATTDDPNLAWALSWPSKSRWTDAPEDQALKELDDWHEKARAALQQLYKNKRDYAETLAKLEQLPHSLHDEKFAMGAEHDRLYRAMYNARNALIESGRKRARGAYQW